MEPPTTNEVNQLPRIYLASNALGTRAQTRITRGDSLVSMEQIQEIPTENTILLTGPPGSGKSTFCHQSVLINIGIRPVIYVATESAPSKVMESLREKGLGEVSPHALGFVDGFHETLGLPNQTGGDSVGLSSGGLTGLGISIYKLQQKIGEKFLLIFDSLTPLYLMSGSQILRFMRQVLLKLAAEGNAVLASMDEGCGKEEDLGAMKSMADGIVEIETGERSRIFNVVKHPKLRPQKIEIAELWNPENSYILDIKTVSKYYIVSMGLVKGLPARTEVGDYVNGFWPNFMRWWCMLSDPKGFPALTYNLNKHSKYLMSDLVGRLPWRARLMLKFLPKTFDRVGQMKKLASFLGHMVEADRSFVFEYLEDVSKTSEHYLRMREHASCWGFQNVGANLALGVLGVYAGAIMGFEKQDRDWNMIETKCVGLGDPYCEVKVVPGEIDELKESLAVIDWKIMEKIRSLLLDRVLQFVLEGKSLWERPKLGDKISLNAFGHIVIPRIRNERYEMAMRLGGAVGGKEVGEQLMRAGLSEDEAAKRTLSLLEHCGVGKVRINETIRIEENCESFIKRAEYPSCHFTTGFLNGFFSVVRKQQVRETKCIAIGDPYCEWKFT